ncbi:MAG: MarR family winged helix-turn-helix transcriptional regulator [Longimicrobiales bacterium]
MDGSRGLPEETSDPGHEPPSAADALKLWIVLSRATAALSERAREDVARHGLTLAEFAVLEALFHKGPLLLGEIQRKILVSSGGITYLVDRLESKGLVRRRPCEDDRRATWAELTADGDALMRRIFPEHALCIRDASLALTASEAKQAAALLKKLGRTAAGLDASTGSDQS